MIDGVLILEGLRADGDVYTADVRVAGHPCTLVVRDTPGLGYRYVQHPYLLDAHPPSTRAVVEQIGRLKRGEPVALPLDLTPAIAATPSPFAALLDDTTRRWALEPAVGVRVDDAAVTVGPRSARLAARVDGAPVEVEGRLYAAPGAVPFVAWHRPPPAELSAEQQRAVFQTFVALAPPSVA